MQEQLERLYGLADKYEMTSLMATCQAILQRMAPSPDMHSHANALRWLHFADRYALHALYERMLQYIEDHLEDISELQELLGMTSSPKASACMRSVHGVYDSIDMRDSMDGTIVHADADAILKPMRRNTWHTAAAGSRTSAGGGCMPQVPGSMPSAADTEATGPAMLQASAAAARAADASTIAEGKGYLR